jgi:hypothetical protein
VFGSDFDCAVVGVRLDSEHDDAVCVTVEPKSDRARVRHMFNRGHGVLQSSHVGSSVYSTKYPTYIVHRSSQAADLPAVALSTDAVVALGKVAPDCVRVAHVPRRSDALLLLAVFLTCSAAVRALIECYS